MEIDFYNKLQVHKSDSQADESQSPLTMAHTTNNNERRIEANLNVVPDVEKGNSRNIMNGAKQLSFITLCSDIMDHDAELMLDNIREDSQASQNDEDYEYLTFQICEGEVMDNEMVNFIEIHMLNDGYLDGDEGSKKDD